MARNVIRTKSNRLRAGERRRRLREANLQPGEVILLDRSRRARKGVRGKMSIQVDLVAKVQIAADFDVRKLLHEIRINLAEHYQAALLAGKRPNRGDLPELKESTLTRNPGRPDQFGVLSGEMAKRWLLLKIRGGPFKASTRIKPWGGDGRSYAINRWLRYGVDVQAIDGAAARVIQETISAWIVQAFPTSGDGVGTPPRVPTRGGELPQF